MESSNVYDVLKERGFIKQETDDKEIREILGSKKVAFYIGYDPTAESLHAGSLMPIMAMIHMQRHGHHPIAVIGAGTAMVGDPSGKTEMRKMLLQETIEANGERFKVQLGRYLDFDGGKASFVNNADWLLDLKYVDFLRDIGRHFSVNRMLTAESYKIRMETGLSFLEFNYQLLQAYDFLVLFRSKNCVLQMGGDDQWGNIVAGIDLIRRTESKRSFGMTFPLLTTANGKKMGKTEKGALWLSPEKTSSYEFYQYWINVDDRDVKKFLSYFTFLPMNEVDRLARLEGAEIREAKAILAFEATKITHGEKEAEKAKDASQSLFSHVNEKSSSIPSSEIYKDELEKGIGVLDLFEKVGLAQSKGDVRRLIKQGGCYVNNKRIEDVFYIIDIKIVDDSNTVMLRAGKKKYCRLLVIEK